MCHVHKPVGRGGGGRRMGVDEASVMERIRWAGGDGNGRRNEELERQESSE